jgi:hypothetical protein
MQRSCCSLNAIVNGLIAHVHWGKAAQLFAANQPPHLIIHNFIVPVQHFIVADSKLGEIRTDFEVKLTKSARMVGIDHSEPGETAPHLVSSITILSIVVSSPALRREPESRKAR